MTVTPIICDSLMNYSNTKVKPNPLDKPGQVSREAPICRPLNDCTLIYYYGYLTSIRP